MAAPNGEIPNMATGDNLFPNDDDDDDDDSSSEEDEEKNNNSNNNNNNNNNDNESEKVENATETKPAEEEKKADKGEEEEDEEGDEEEEAEGEKKNSEEEVEEGSKEKEKDENSNEKNNNEAEEAADEEKVEKKGNEEEEEEEEEEEDAEFDGDDGIVGGRASVSGVSASTPSIHRDSSVSGGGTGGVGGGADSTRKQRPGAEPRDMEVLNIPPPQRRHGKTGKKDSSGGISLHMTKLPNVVGINPDPFEPDTYDAATEETEYKGYIHNMIRWRYKRDAKTAKYIRDPQNRLQRESNARIVRWSDSSYTLHVGSETFAIDEVNANNTETNNNNNANNNNTSDNLTPANKIHLPGFSGINGYLYLSQKATIASSKDNDDQQQPTVLECMAPITSKMTPRPSSLQSEAHKNLTLAVRQRNMKKARIAEFTTIVDPEKEKSERIKNKEDLNRQNHRKSSSARNSAGGKQYFESSRRSRSSYDFEENYDNINLRNVKRGRHNDDYDDYDDYEEDDEGDDNDDWSKQKKKGFARGSRRPPRGAGSKDNDSSDEGGGNNKRRRSDDEDDISSDEAQFVIDSSDDEGANINAKKRSNRALVDEDED